MTPEAPPFCFSRKQWVLYVKAAENAKPGPASYCTDCTPEYQRQMVRAGKCGHPQARFTNDEGGWIQGHRV